MAATLQLERRVLGLGFELRRGRFAVVVDGEEVGLLEQHGTLAVPIDPGHHTVQIRAGRYSSRNGSFDAADGAVVTFGVHGARIWPTYVASIFKPDLAISLRRE